jgi:hypothetical protein
MTYGSTKRVVSSAGTSPTLQCFGLYQGSVANTNDPLLQGRVQLFVPQALGSAVSNWAKTLGDSPISGAVSVGQYVFVLFIGGDRNQPVYIPQNWVSATNFTLAGALTVNGGLTVTGGATIDILNSGLTVYKAGSGGTTRTNVTVSSDPDLSGMTIAKHGIYRVEVVLNVSGTSTGNIQYQFTVPSGAAGQYVAEQFNLAGTYQFITSGWTANNTASTTAPGATGLIFKGILDNSGNNAGTFSFQWGQNTNNGSTTVGQYSYMKLERLV